MGTADSGAGQGSDRNPADLVNGVTLAELIEDARPRVIAALAGHCRDLDLAEDGFADAVAALLALPAAKIPTNVAGWLFVTAKRRIIDAVRRDARGAALLAREALLEDDMGEILGFPDPFPDDRLRLIFACAHPAIAPDVRIALALRTICGVAMERLAGAFLVPVATLYQRLTRAKAKIRDAGIGFEVPGPRQWPDRIEAVLATLELGYAVAYADGAGALDADLAPEVRRLAGLLVELVPDDPEVLGLAALIELAESRRGARVDPDGAMIPLSQQDVARWDDAAIARAHALMERAATLGHSGPRQLQAAIHLTHALRKSEGSTDWAAITKLYAILAVIRPGPAVATAQAVALAQLEGAAAGLAALDAIDAASVAHHRGWHSARGHMLAKLGRRNEAHAALTRALELSAPPAEAAYLAVTLAALVAAAPVSLATS
jgi:RNA polymerase sigma-70 factor, ECF subfamily